MIRTPQVAGISLEKTQCGARRKPDWVQREPEETLTLLAENLAEAWILDGNFMSKPRWGGDV